MKISGYKIHDSGAALGAIGTHFVGGDLVIGGTASAVINWINIRKTGIAGYSLEAAVNTAVAWTQTFTAGTVVTGNEFVLTIKVPDSRQVQNKIYKHIAVAGDTAQTVANAFRALINGDSSLPITGTGTTTLILTADTAGTGVNYIGTSGATNTSTFTGGSAVSDAQVTDAAYYAAKYEGVSAADFGSAVRDYDAYVIEYISDTIGSHGITGETRYAAVFTDNGVAGAALDNALTGNYTAVTEQDGAVAVG
jgi:phage tail sheath gpL-like